MINRSYSSTRPLYSSVLSSAVIPYFMMCPPLCPLSVASSFAASPLRSDAFQPTLSSVVDATSFFSPLIRPMYAFTVMVDQTGAKVCDAAEKEELDVVELPKRVLGALVIE